MNGNLDAFMPSWHSQINSPYYFFVFSTGATARILSQRGNGYLWIGGTPECRITT